MRSSSGYDEFQKSSLHIYPSISLLKNVKTHFSVTEGSCPSIYSKLYDDLLNGHNNKKMNGMLMCDEMKLKNDIYINCMSGVSVGFASTTGDLMDINNEISNLFEGCVPGVTAKDDNVTSDEKIGYSSICRTMEIPVII